MRNDWTRSEESAKAIVKYRTSRNAAPKHPWERKIIKWLSIFLIVTAIIHVVWRL